MPSFAALALLLMVAAPALAQGSVQTPQASTNTLPAAPEPATARVAIETSQGTIVLALETERAPVTSANFLRYVENKKLNGLTFYRAMKTGPGIGLIQGGIENDPRRALPPIAHEPTSATGILHLDGTVSMARYAPGSATGDFFITVGPFPSLDADPAAPGDNLGFAAFGRVVEGMDVVRRILEAPTSPTKGEGAMRGQMLAAPIRIIGARRLD